MSLFGDSRFSQVQALLDDARTLLHEIQEEGGHTPVDTRQLRQIRDSVNHALVATDYFTVPNKTRWS
jgi:hypothetical protein